MHRRDSGQVVSASTSPVKRGLCVVEQRHPSPVPPHPLHCVCREQGLDGYREWNIVPTKDKSPINQRVTSLFFGAVKRETESGVCFGETLNKDNLENGPRHSAASVYLCFPTHARTELPKAAPLVFVLVLLPDLG